jgi:4-amino-4-deoxy-L-arabinose transferase-like glycosyltransferase
VILRRVPVGWLGLVGASVLAVLWRAPFIHLPITTDEAGYVTIARLWAQGEPLYRAAWVDRPQGLLIVFRMLAAFGGSMVALRMTAVAVGVVLVLLVAAVGRELGGDRTAVAAALVAGALGCSPFLESFTLSGELLAAVPSVACVLCGARWLRTRRPAWLVAAGLLCGCALLVKQSAFDGGLAVAVVIALRVRALRPLVVLAASAAVPVAAAALTAPSFHDWWFAVVAYRFHGAGFVNGVSSISWAGVADVAVQLVKGIGPLLAVAALGLRSAPLLVRVWVVTASLGALGGGLFHAHYLIELGPPLALAAGFGLVHASRRVAIAVTAAACLAAVATVVPTLGQSTRRDVHLIFPRDRHLVSDAAVARLVRRASGPHTTLLVLPPTASIGYLSHRQSAIPYLWARNVETIRSAAAAERLAILHRRPATIVVEEQPGFLHAVGLTTATILRYYRPVVHRHGVTIYVAR